MNVVIEDYYDGFSIFIYDDYGTNLVQSVGFGQEDNREALKKVFDKLGIECEYKEVC